MNRLAALLATGFGIGRLPLAPGTWASLAALPVGWWLAFAGNWPAILGAAILATLAGIWACGHYARHRGLEDPGECVLDEVAGQWFALVPLAATGRLGSISALAAAFALFRFFDIVKPFPIGRLETISGGIGVMADDVGAGLAAAAILWVAIAQGWL